MYRVLGRCPEDARKTYRDLFYQELAPESLESVRFAVQHNHVLGGERFQRQVEGMLQRRLGTGRPGRPAGSSSDGGDGPGMAQVVRRVP